MKQLLSVLIVLTLIVIPMASFAENWTCPVCGADNSGNFCPNDAQPQPDSAAAMTSQKNVCIGDTITFGSYPQGTTGEKQPVEWQVLGLRDGYALLISRLGLECMPYDASSKKWSESGLRTWLNADFVDAAFTAEEQQRIAPATLDNSIIDDQTTLDRVFILSETEILRFFPSPENHWCLPSTHAFRNGAEVLKDVLIEGKESATPWIRGAKRWNCNYSSPTEITPKTRCVVRPAMWLLLDESGTASGINLVDETAAAEVTDLQAMIDECRENWSLSLDDRMANLNTMALAYGADFDSGLWDQSLNYEIALDGVPENWTLDTENAEKIDHLPADMKGLRFVVLQKGTDVNNTILAGGLQVRLCDSMRAASVAETEAIIWVIQTNEARKDYTGSAYNRVYTIYATNLQTNQTWLLYQTSTNPPTMGKGTLYGRKLQEKELWLPLIISIFGKTDIELEDGTLLRFISNGRSSILYESVRGKQATVTQPELPAEVNGCRLVEIGEMVFKDFAFTCVTIPEGVITIDEYAFLNCSELVSVSLPSTLKTLGKGVFSKCGKLGTLILPDGLQSAGAIFYQCASLEKLYIPASVNSSDLLNQIGNAKPLTIYTPAGSYIDKNVYWHRIERCVSADEAQQLFQ